MTSSFPGTEPAPGLVAATQLRTAAGAPLPVEVTLTNNAAAPRVLTVGALGVDAAWLPAPVRTAALDPGQSVVVTLVLTPTQGTVPAQYPFAFTAQSLDPATGRPAGAAVVMVDSTLVVNPRNQLTLELRPRSVSTVSSRSLKLALRNSGNEAARVSLEVKTSPRVRVRFRTKAIEVLPGATELVRGRATVTRRRLFGGTEHHTYTVSASGTESLRHVEGSVTQHPLVGTMLMKAVALLAVLAIWIGAAVIFIPQLANRIGDRSSETTTTSTVEDEKGPGADQGGDDGSSGGSDDTGGKGDQGNGGQGKGDQGKSGGNGGTQQAADTDDSVMALTGTVAGEQPAGVRVSLEPTSLVDEDAQGGVGVGVSSSELGTSGMSLASSFLNWSLPTTPPDRTATTTSDGSWAFSGVKKPGYYLLTFSKPGFQKQSFVVDSTSEASAEPLEVDLTAGEGTLSGTVTGPRGAVGAATVTITDGTNTITTSSNSRGRIGHWSVKGLSTPSAYVVQASKPGLSSESRMVDLSAGGTATADLRLRNGVASLVGTVRAVNEQGKLSGVGGATVTVTSESGEVRSATTLTQGDRAARSSARVAADFVGTYTVPGLPAPGTYVVTLSGPGLQTQTSKVDLEPGQSKAGIDADLVSSSGSVSGTVKGVSTTGVAQGVIGAGLTLTNADNTYKTMSTSQPAGSYLFDGVAPGTYALSTQFFGFVTDHVTVTVRAGRTTNVNRLIDELAGGVLAGRSQVQGQVVDAGTGVAIKCPAGNDECLTARVFEPDVDTGAEPSTDDGGVTYSTLFLPGDMFTLPEDPELGLLPGLHTIEVTAPGYELATTQVQVPADGTVNLGTVGLYPAPKVTGTITSVVGTPSGPTCIWVVPAGQDAPTEPCADAADVSDPAATCTFEKGTFDLGATEAEPVCAFVNGRGSYTIEVLKHGSYTVYVRPSDPLYEPPDPAVKVLGVGDTQNFSVPLHRKGTLTVTARKPGTSGNLVAAALITVTLDSDTPGADDIEGTTDTTGRVVFTGLSDATYTVKATDGDLSDSVSKFVGLDQEISADLTLTHPIGNVVGQVTANISGVQEEIDGAEVTVVAPTSFTPSSTEYGQVVMTSDALGCFAIRPDPASYTPPSSAPGTPEAAPCLASGWTTSSLKTKTFRSNAPASVEIRKTGYERLALTNRQLTGGLNSFSLEPTPIDATQLALESSPPDSGINWASVGFNVEIAGGGTFVSLTASQVGPAADGAATLKWNDSRLPAGRARPGDYKVTASIPGYEVEPMWVSCEIGAPACVWADGATEMTFVKQGALTVSAVDGAGDVNGAQFTLMRGATEHQTVTAPADSNSVTFSGLVANAADYKVRIRAAGHAFGVAGGGSGSLTTTCGPTFTIPPGATLSCTATLPKLNTVTGVVQGIQALPPALSPFRELEGAQVQLTQCLDVEHHDGADYCDEAAATPTFTAPVNDDGEFTLTGNTVTAGIEDGDWLLTATKTGFHLPQLPGAAEEGILLEGLSGDVSQTIRMYVDLAEVTVNVTDQAGPVSGATVKLQTPAGADLPYVPDESGDPGTYVFEDVVPGAHKIDVQKAGYISTNSTTEFEEGPATFTRNVGIVRGSSIASGVVTGGIDGVRVRICDDATCSNGTAEGSNRQPLQTTTGPNPATPTQHGYFKFSTVPDGTWWVVFSKHGYVTEALGSYVFSYTAASFTNINPTLDGVTRNVEIKVSPSWENDVLSTAEVTLSRPGGPTLAPVAVGGTGVASFTGVPWGCWDVDVELPLHHYGDIGDVVDTGGGDPEVTGCSDGVVVSGDETDEDPASGEVDVDEGAVAIKVGKSLVPGFSGSGFPSPVVVSITRAAGDPGVDPFNVVVEAAAATTVWLPTGGGDYTVRAAPSPATGYWPAVELTTVAVPEEKPEDDDAVEANLTLQGEAATLVVTVAGDVAGDPQAKLTLTSSNAVVPDEEPHDYTAAVETVGYTYTFSLPPGTWDLSAAIGTRVKTGSVVIDERDPPGAETVYRLTITVDPPTPTGASAGTPGSFSPTGASRPASLAALGGITANPTTAWATGQHVVLGDNSKAHWTGTAWAAGPAPSSGGGGG